MKPLTILVIFASTVSAGSGFSPADLWLLHEASGARIRADGRQVAYVESWRDQAAGAVWSNLWLAAADGQDRRRWTEGRWRDWSPRWSPDGGRIAWLSSRGGPAHIRIRALDGGPERVIETRGAPPFAFAWSASGDAFAYTAALGAAAAPVWAPPEILPYIWRDEPGTAVFIVPAAGGPPRRISAGVAGCRGEPAWLLDGKSLAVACDAGIYLFSLSGGAPRLLTEDFGRYQSPVLSPDGGHIAYLFTPRRPQSYTVRKLWVMRTDGSRTKVLSGSLDRDASHPQWSSDSRTVYFLADDRGATHVYAAHNDGKLRQVTARPERLRGFTLADNGRAVAVRSTAAAGDEIVTFTVDLDSRPVTVAAPGRDLFRQRELGSAEEFSYSSDGHAVQAWLVKPPGFDAGRKYPLIVDVADAPRRMYGYEFQPRAQALAAAGFVVLCANPRGTPGYGEEFGSLLRSRYPGDDFDDLMRGVDAAIAKGYIDAQRLHIAGGLLAAWAIGHTARFRSAVARRPIVDWTADIALSPDGPRRAAEWMSAMPWEDPEQYWKHSPIYFAASFQTPTLILAGEHDPESDELYFALRQRKVKTAMVRIPSAPSAPVLELQAMLAWLKP